MGRRLAYAALLVLLCAQPACRPQDTESARKFVERVYADYANPDQRHQEQRQHKFYTPALLRLLLADRRGHSGEVGNLDGNPICDCQDPGNPGELKARSITVTATDATHAQAVVAFVIVKEVRTATLSLVATAAGWRIDDIATPDTPSLRRLLRGKH